MRLRPIFTSKFSVLLLLAYFIPFSFLLWFVTSFGVNVPQADEWSFVGLFQHIVSGKATFQDFFAQHNEHRILFPRLIISALAFVSGWNIQWELYFNVVLGAIGFLALLKLSSDQSEQRDRTFHIANLATCFITFSVVQWENWLWGFQIAWFLVNVCLIIAVLALSSNLCPTLRVKVALAATSCLVASFSLAHGLLTWIAVVPSLLVCCKDTRQLRKVGLIWVVLFFTTLFIYLTGYQKPPSHPDIWFFLKEPKLTATYFLTLLGDPLLYNSDVSDMLGLAILINFGYFVTRVVKNAGSRFSRNAAPWLSLGCFAILFDLITTLGRAGFGTEQAHAPRYTTVAILLLIALIQLWRLRFNESASADQTVHISGSQGASIHAFVMIILTFLVLVASINSLPAAEGLRSRLQYGQRCLEVATYVAQSPGNCLQFLFPDSKPISAWTTILNQIGFRRFSGKTVEFVAEPTQPYGYLDAPASSQTPVIVKKNCINCGAIPVSGWAILPEQAKPAQLVFLARSGDSETFFTNTYVNRRSPDVAKALGNDHYRHVRWTVAVSPDLLPLGKTVITAWVYNPKGRQFVKLRGEPTLSVEE